MGSSVLINDVNVVLMGPNPIVIPINFSALSIDVESPSHAGTSFLAIATTPSNDGLSRTCSLVRNSRNDDFEALLQRWRFIETDEHRWKFLEETCWFEHNRGFKKIKKYPTASILEHFDFPDVKERQTFEAIEYLRKYRQK